MRAQIDEILKYDSKKYIINIELLYEFLELLPNDHLYHPSKTENWKGYYASWEIRNKKLYLIELEGYLVKNEAVGMEYFFYINRG